MRVFAARLFLSLFHPKPLDLRVGLSVRPFVPFFLFLWVVLVILAPTSRCLPQHEDIPMGSAAEKCHGLHDCLREEGPGIEIRFTSFMCLRSLYFFFFYSSTYVSLSLSAILQSDEPSSEWHISDGTSFSCPGGSAADGSTYCIPYFFFFFFLRGLLI